MEQAVIMAGGYPVTMSKAAAIVASGNSISVHSRQVVVVVGGADRIARHAGRGPRVWSSAAQGVNYAAAECLAEAMRLAAGVARTALVTPDPFARVPDWVQPRLAALGADPGRAGHRYRAASRYARGDVTLAGAWQHVIAGCAEQAASAAEAG